MSHSKSRKLSNCRTYLSSNYLIFSRSNPRNSSFSPSQTSKTTRSSAIILRIFKKKNHVYWNGSHEVILGFRTFKVCPNERKFISDWLHVGLMLGKVRFVTNQRLSLDRPLGPRRSGTGLWLQSKNYTKKRYRPLIAATGLRVKAASGLNELIYEIIRILESGISLIP